MSEPLLRVRRLNVRFGHGEAPVHAVNDVDLTVGDGEILGIVGESGCGKSTLVRAALGLLAPPAVVEGDAVELAGHGDLLRMPRRRLRETRGTVTGYVAQNPFGSLNPIYSIERQFHEVLRAHRRGVKRSASREVGREMLRRVGIAGPDRVLDGYAHQLSGGMAQRVVIALAVTLEPRLLVADEPTTGLDVTVQRQILDLIAGLAASESRSMVLVTHDLGVVAQYCARVAVMYAGRIVEEGPVRRVFTEPGHPYTAALLAAIPRPGRPLERLGGTVPDLRRLGAGCPFAPRCRFSHDRCAARPDLAPVERDHTAACHLEGGVSAVPART